MKELSIFIDESGDFGEYDYHSPYYIIAIVMHNQGLDISNDLNHLETELAQLGYSKHCVHAGPIIRQEAEYRYVEIEERQRILKRMMTFLRKLDIHCHCVYIEKKHLADEVAVTAHLSKEISKFIRQNYEFFISFDKIKIYYDNGQIEVNKILASVFHALLDNVEFRKVIPAEYRLFQVADLVCTLKLLELKMNAHQLSKSEKNFFIDERTLKKNYLKPLADKQLHS